MHIGRADASRPLTRKKGGSALRNCLTAGTALGGLFAFAVAPQAASAQTAGQAPAALEEVVVTATRVETNVQSTPLAIDVYGGENLQSQGIRDLAGLATIAPAVSISGSGGGTVVTIRGISSRDTTETGDPAVAINVDGFYQDRAYAIGLTQYDLDRIEVAKGPQGTLAGRNATAGAISIITRKPEKRLGGYAGVEVGTYGAINTEGALNIPFTDRVQGRASFSTTYHNGYRDSGPLVGRTDDANAKSARIQLSAQPTDNLELHVLAQHTEQSDNNSFNLPIPYSVNPDGSVIHYLVHPKSSYFNSPSPANRRLNDTQYRWDAVLSTPIAKISYLGGYDDLEFHALNASANAIKPQNLGGGFSAGNFDQNERPKTWNHEVRLTSPDQNARLTWQFGIYYFRETNHLQSVNRNYPSGSVNIGFDYQVLFDSLSEFGQVAFKITPDLKLTVGARHNKDKKQEDGTFGNAFFQRELHGLYEKGINTYHVALDWQATPYNMLYAKFDTGYKAGGFKDISTYGPEEVKTYEVGSKNRFLDNRLQLNAALYYSDYTGQQVSQSVGLGSGTGGTIVVNAGSTRFFGADVDAVALLPSGRFEFNVAYLDAEFTSFPVSITQTYYTGTGWSDTLLGNQDLAGNVPPGAPKWSVGAALEHYWSLWGGTVTARVQTKATTKQYFTFYNRQNEKQGGYTNTNLYLTYAPDNADWEIQGYIRHLENNYILSNAGESAFTHTYGTSWIPPRTMGVRALLRY